MAATLTYLDAKEGEPRLRPIVLKAVKGEPGEYRAFLPHDTPGRFELRVDKGGALEPALLSYRVELPAHHELELAGLAEEALRQAAQTSGGRFYREEDLGNLVAAVEPRKAAFSRRQEILLWSPLALIVFAGLLTTEWVLRKMANLS